MKTKKPNLDVSQEDRCYIEAIVARAKKRHPGEFDSTSLEMDICATHNTNPLRLAELLKAGDGDFFHDVYGIRTNIDRRTGELTDHFLPRFTARPE